jgi:PASTA domain
LGAGILSGTVTATLTRLTPGTAYHYRFVAANEAGTTYGEDRTFTTLAAQQVPPPPPPPPPRCVVPKLKGKTLPTARKAVTKAHCAVGTVRRAHSKKVRRGRVISQRPPPGARLPNRAKVSVVVSRGSKRRR